MPLRGQLRRCARGASGDAHLLFVLIVITAAFVVQLQANWSRIAVRVAGSWIAASGLLMLGWSFRGS